MKQQTLFVALAAVIAASMTIVVDARATEAAGPSGRPPRRPNVILNNTSRLPQTWSG
ncbi:MAG: hypothetical protein NTY19_52065 [Planctomycetota bacterium]|nr:hypothetical protein [Planctomycetota bacterium]